MIPKEIQDITREDIESLIQNKIQESITLEYKEKLKFETYEERKEFLADVSAFANAVGGDLIFGISGARDQSGSPNGQPEKAVGVEIDNWDDLKNTLINIVRNSIQPHIPAVRWHQVEGFERGPVIIARIQRSWASPHMVVSQKSRRFYTRTSGGKFLMDAAEIRAAFLRTAGAEEKIEEYRNDRLSRIMTGDTPLSQPDGPKLVIHLIPLISTEPTFTVDLSKFPKYDNNRNPFSSKFRPLNARYEHPSHIYTFDGVALYEATGGSTVSSYVQLSRNGALELVEELPVVKEGFLDIIPFQAKILTKLSEYCSGLADLKVPYPYVLNISLTSVKDFQFSLDAMKQKYDTGLLQGYMRPIDRNVLILPELLIEDTDFDVSHLTPHFDMIWNAAGLPNSPRFDSNGNLIGI